LKILHRIYGPRCEGRQWRKRYNRESEELYNERNIVYVIKFSRLRWECHVVPMDKKRYWGQTLEVNEDMVD